MLCLLKPLSDEELDARLRSITPPPTEELEKRLIESIPETPGQQSAWARPRTWVAVGTATVVLVVAGVLTAGRLRPASAALIVERMAHALRGTCLVSTVTGRDDGQDCDVAWICPLESEEGSGPLWGVRQYLRGTFELYYGWYGDRLTVYSSESGVRTISHCRRMEWLESGYRGAHIGARLALLLAGKALKDPSSGVELVGKDTVDGHRCHVISWRIKLASPAPDLLEKVCSRELWWVDRESDLPVVSCLYWAKIGDPVPSVASARSILSKAEGGPMPEFMLIRYKAAPVPQQGFFELGDLPAGKTHDARPQQGKLLASSIGTFEGEGLRLTLHEVQSSGNGCIFATVSVRATGVSPECGTSVQAARVPVEIHLDRLPWDRRASREEDSKEGHTLWRGRDRGPFASTRGREYFLEAYPLFSVEDADVYGLVFLPLDYGQPPEEGDQIDFAVHVQTTPPPTGLLWESEPRVTADVNMSADIPVPTFAADIPPSWMEISREWLCVPFKVPSLSQAYTVAAMNLRGLGRPEDALRAVRLAERIYAGTPKTRRRAYLEPRHFEAGLYMDIYADLGDAERVRHYANLQREYLQTHPRWQYAHNEQGRDRMLDHVDRCLAYIEGSRQGVGE